MGKYTERTKSSDQVNTFKKIFLYEHLAAVVIVDYYAIQSGSRTATMLRQHYRVATQVYAITLSSNNNYK